MTAANFAIGDRARVDITDADDPDFQWHGEHGTIVDMFEDNADTLTNDSRDANIYRLDLEDYDHQLDLRWRDLRPLFDQ